MSTSAGALIALFALDSATLINWLAGELYFRRGPTIDIWMALLANYCVLAAVAWAGQRICGGHRTEVALRFATLATMVFGLLGVATAHIGLGALSPLARCASAVATAVVGMRLIPRGMWGPLLQAIVVASLAFIAAPSAWRAIRAPRIVWHVTRESQTDARVAVTATNRVIILFDEFTSTAAYPLVAELRGSGLFVTASAVRPAGKNTLNAIPAMLTGLDFGQAMACGRSAICSGGNVLDFSKLSVNRSDIDVVGTFHPYCDIRGLRSCYQTTLPHEQRNAFRSLANAYLSRIGLPLRDRQRYDESRMHLHSQAFAQQVHALLGAPFWEQGGVLFAHMDLPHPPGLNGIHTLDEDYQANITRATQLALIVLGRLKQTFRDDFALLIISDHPLRPSWCQYYGAPKCSNHPEFWSQEVPLIIVSPKALPTIAVKTNAEVFGAF